MEEPRTDNPTLPGADVPIRLRLLPLFGCEYVGENIEELTGRPASAFHSDPSLLREIAIEADRSKYDEIDFLAQDPARPALLRWRHRDGRLLWVELRFAQVRDDRGRVAAVEGTLRDVTRRERAEEDLTRLGRMCSDAFDGVIAFDPRTLTFLRIDAKGRKLLGLGSGAVEAHGLAEVLDAPALQRVKSSATLVAAGELDRTSLELTIYARDGAARTVLARMTGADGDPPTVTLFVEDLSNARQAAAEQSGLGAAVEAAADAVAIVNPYYSFVYVNPAFHAITGYARTECVGYRRDILDAVLPDPEIWAAMRAGRMWRGFVVARGKGNVSIDAAASVSPVRSPGEDEPPSFVIVLHDVGAQRAAMSAVERERRSRDRLTEALGKLDNSASAEGIATAVCHSLLALPDVAGALVVDLATPREPAVVSVQPSSGFERVARIFTDPGGAARLAERVAGSQWVEPTVQATNGLAGLAANSRSGARDRGIEQEDPLPGLLVCSPFCHEGRPVGLLVCVGSEGMRTDLKSMEGLAATAGALLGPAFADGARRRAVRRKLYEVVSSRAFRPLFQPIIDLRDGSTVGWEATTRFDDGTRAGRRFAEAVELGFTVELEAAAMRMAVAEAALNETSGWLSLNVSAAFLASGDRLTRILPLDRPVVLELANATDLPEAAREAIRGLPASVRIAVDAAQTEVPALRAIVEVRPALVKLPIDLVRGIHGDRVRRALVAGLEQFARATESELVAVGIDDEADLVTLTSLRVSYGQGDYLGEPGFFPIPAGV